MRSPAETVPTPTTPKRSRGALFTLHVASVVLLAGCGGADGAGGPAPSPTPSVPTTVTSPGFVYAREDSIAYPPDYVPTTGLSGVNVSLGGATAVTAANGAFSITGSATVTRSFETLQATANGWIPTWYPWYTADAATPIALGVYPEVSVTPRPGMLKGAWYFDAGGWIAELYARGLSTSTADRMRSTLNANTIGYQEFIDVTSLDSVGNTITMGYPKYVASAAMIKRIADDAHARNLTFVYTVELDIRGYFSLFRIPKTRDAFWDAYFAAWTPLILERAAIARDVGAEYFSIDTKKGYLSVLPIARVRSLIAAIRAAGYTGRIMYISNYESTQRWSELTAATPGFVESFDAIGIGMIAAVRPPKLGDPLGRAYSRRRMRDDLQPLMAVIAAQPRPVILHVATPSVHGGVSSDEFIEPCLVCGTLATQRTRDYQQQADLYAALAEVVNASPTGTGPGRVAGILSWGYMWVTDMFEGGGIGAAVFDKSASIRGKPAEAVLSWWFKRW